VQPLRDALVSDEPVVRREALRALGKLRERASIDPQIVIPSLLASLKDGDASVRQVAVTYLGIVRDRPKEEVAGLIGALADAQAEVRAAAALALSSYGADAEPAIPALKKASTSDPDDDVKQEAARSLVHIAETKDR
jgi:HEAT repeat protein